MGGEEHGRMRMLHVISNEIQIKFSKMFLSVIQIKYSLNYSQTCILMYHKTDSKNTLKVFAFAKNPPLNWAILICKVL